MPSVSLAAVNAPIAVIGRQSVFRGAIVASAKSDIKTLADLKGKKLYGPFGSSIYLAALAMLEKAGLKPGKDVEMVNMGFADLSDAMRAGKVDAVFVWDPWVENFVEKGLVRVLGEDTALTMVIRDARRIQEGATRTPPSGSCGRTRKRCCLPPRNHALVNQWFQEPEPARAAQPDGDPEDHGLRSAMGREVLKDIRVSFTDAELTRYLGLGNRAHALKIYPAEPPLQQKLDLEPPRRSMRRAGASIRLRSR